MRSLLWLALLVGAVLSEESRESKEQVEEPQRGNLCQPFQCRTPDCRCASTDLGGSLKVDEIPQLVMVTFDDAVTAVNYEYVEQTVGRYMNPDGCEASSTFYVSHEYTDYSRVHELWAQGHEIALHSITHSPYLTYWRNLSVIEMVMEFGDQRDMMSHFAKIPIKDIKGMRVPLFQLAGENSYKAMVESGLEYDSSWPTVKFIKPGMWPYTLDYYSNQDCSVGSCPEESVPGAWVQPILSWLDENDSPCAMVDACTAVPDSNVDKLINWMIGNFHRIYDTNRAPFGVHLHAAWFQKGRNYLDAFKGFLDYLQTLDDVFLVQTAKVIDYVKNPVPISKFQSCSAVQKPSCTPRFCPLQKQVGNGHEERFMTVCTACPRAYPWLGDPFGDGLDAIGQRKSGKMRRTRN